MINVALGNTDANLSFTKADFAACYPTCEGLIIGNSITDIVNNTTAQIVNYTDAMRTNADQQTEGLQNALLKQDANGVPTALADSETLRFDS